MNATAIALECQRGFTRTAWESLTADERRLMIADIEGLATELAQDDADELDYPGAVAEMRRRLGGVRNLPSYCRCLVVGENRRNSVEHGNYRRARTDADVAQDPRS